MKNREKFCFCTGKCCDLKTKKDMSNHFLCTSQTDKFDFFYTRVNYVVMCLRSELSKVGGRRGERGGGGGGNLKQSYPVVENLGCGQNLCLFLVEYEVGLLNHVLFVLTQSSIDSLIQSFLGEKRRN